LHLLPLVVSLRGVLLPPPQQQQQLMMLMMMLLLDLQPPHVTLMLLISCGSFNMGLSESSNLFVTLPPMPYTLVLLRHGESQWNAEVRALQQAPLDASATFSYLPFS